MPEAHKRAYRHPKYKTSYHINNWPEYEKSLRNRGDITVLMELYLPCPDHTTVSRRNRTLNVCRCTGSLPEGPVHFIVDSTGLKIYGQGEWHSKKHGKRWRRRWMKLHIGVDENGRILASKITDGHEHDPSQVPDLLAQIDREIDRFVGD